MGDDAGRLSLLFRFRTDGTVAITSDYRIPDETLYTKYYFLREPEGVRVFLSNAQNYLSSVLPGSDASFIIPQLGTTDLKVIGTETGSNYTWSSREVSAVEAEESAKSTVIALKRAGLINGVIRDAQGHFKAHYAISLLKNEIAFSLLKDRKLTHSVAKIQEVSENKFTFESTDFGDFRVGELSFRIMDSDVQMTIDNDHGWVVTPNKDVVPYFTGKDYKTHIVSKNNSKGDASDQILSDLSWLSVGDVEISDREARPLVMCPGPQDAIWYIFFDANLSVRSESDRIYFSRTPGYMPFGGADRIAETEEKLRHLLEFWYSPEGLYMVRDSDKDHQYIYFLSPMGDAWIKAQR